MVARRRSGSRRRGRGRCGARRSAARGRGGGPRLGGFLGRRDAVSWVRRAGRGRVVVARGTRCRRQRRCGGERDREHDGQCKKGARHPSHGHLPFLVVKFCLVPRGRDPFPRLAGAVGQFIYI